MSAPSARRRGISLAEILVATSVVLVIAAIVVPAVGEQRERQRVLEAAETFRDLADAIWNFRAGVGVNPGALRDLTTPITVAGTNSCGVAYSAANANAWAGPYYRVDISTTGLPISSDNFGRAQNALVRTPAGVSTPGTLSITVTDVQLEAVTELNALMDGDNSSTVGRVRWTTPANAQGFVTLSYHVAINGC